MRIRNRKRARSGFTLIEILLVLVIIAVIAGIVVVNVGGQQVTAFNKTAAAQCATLRSAMLRYQVIVGALPSQMEALWELPSDISDQSLWVPQLDKPLGLDPWGRAYIYETDGSQFQIRCVGADGQPNTDDDIVS